MVCSSPVHRCLVCLHCTQLGPIQQPEASRPRFHTRDKHSHTCSQHCTCSCPMWHLKWGSQTCHVHQVFWLHSVMCTYHLQVVLSILRQAKGIDCKAVCVVLQYMVGYQAVASIAGSIIFFMDGSSFSHAQVTLTTPGCGQGHATDVTLQLTPYLWKNGMWRKPALMRKTISGDRGAGVYV